MSDDTTVVAYLMEQEGMVSRVMCYMAHEIILWSELHSAVLVRYIPGKKISWLIYWVALTRSFQQRDRFFPRCSTWLARSSVTLISICLLQQQPQCYLSTCLQFQIPWHGGCLSTSMVQSDHLCLSSLRASLSGLGKSSFVKALLGAGYSSLASEGLVHQSSWSSCCWTSWAPHAVEPTLPDQTHVWKFHRGLETLRLHAWRLSSDLSERLAIHKELWKSSLRTSRVPQ